jgi:TonB family protein
VADVLIVCVREDEPQAKALAEMFEAAGFSIGGAPSSDAALRSSGAGLVVWSQASIRSRPFLDAAQRVINARKAIVASLIEPPPPSSIGDSPVFDLSRWDGDTEDPALDPLFFAIDRMVNSARTSVGGEADVEEPYAPPARPQRAPAPPPAEPTYTRSAPPQPTYSRSPPPAPAPDPLDPLGTEAEHWRAIRDSRDPTDFMDYLARYGPTGAFAEVAELRLKQLTTRSDARTAPPPRPTPPAPPQPRLTPRLETPPSRRAEAPPPPRRIEPPPPRRADPPRRFERGFERADLREPPKEGGPMRAFILIGLLGGAALAGGLYFGGGGMPNFAAQPTQEDVASTSAPPLFDDSGEPASAEEIAGVPLSDTTALSQPQRTEIAARTTENERPPAPAQREEREPPPAPVTSWNRNSGQGGPVSLRAGDATPPGATTNTGSANTAAANPPPVQVAATQPVSAPPTTRATPRPTVQWAQRPSARRYSEAYPARALREGMGGRVELNCSVRSNQTLSCNVASESPAGLGFGQAALSVAQSYRASPGLSDGSSSTGAEARIVVQFQAPSQ